MDEWIERGRERTVKFIVIRVLSGLEEWNLYVTVDSNNDITRRINIRPGAFRFKWRSEEADRCKVVICFYLQFGAFLARNLNHLLKWFVCMTCISCLTLVYIKSEITNNL